MSEASTAFGIAPMPICSVAPSGIRSTICAAIARSRSSGTAGATSTSGASRSVQPSSWEAWIWLRPCVRGICRLTSTKNGTFPISEATYSAFVPSEK